jgi:hypothetical protein
VQIGDIFAAHHIDNPDIDSEASLLGGPTTHATHHAHRSKTRKIGSHDRPGAWHQPQPTLIRPHMPPPSLPIVQSPTRPRCPRPSAGASPCASQTSETCTPRAPSPTLTPSGVLRA